MGFMIHANMKNGMGRCLLSLSSFDMKRLSFSWDPCVFDRAKWTFFIIKGEKCCFNPALQTAGNESAFLFICSVGNKCLFQVTGANHLSALLNLWSVITKCLLKRMGMNVVYLQERKVTPAFLSQKSLRCKLHSLRSMQLMSEIFPDQDLTNCMLLYCM